LADNLNPLLGPRYSRWLEGAIGRIASKSEREEYLRLDNDQAAEDFIGDFWSKPEHELIREIYQKRAKEADRNFTEAQVDGRRTDRGMVFILYGQPKEVEFEEFRDVDEPPVLLWRYDRRRSGIGLDGERPAKTFRFVKAGDLTRLFRKGDPLDPTEQRRRELLRRPM